MELPLINDMGLFKYYINNYGSFQGVGKENNYRPFDADPDEMRELLAKGVTPYSIAAQRNWSYAVTRRSMLFLRSGDATPDITGETIYNYVHGGTTLTWIAKCCGIPYDECLRRMRVAKRRMADAAASQI